MSMTIRAHFDGKVIVPEEPVDLPVGQSLEVELKLVSRLATLEGSDYQKLSIEKRLERLRQSSGRISGPVISDEALRRENLYEERP